MCGIVCAARYTRMAFSGGALLFALKTIKKNESHTSHFSFVSPIIFFRTNYLILLKKINKKEIKIRICYSTDGGGGIFREM